VLGTLVAPILLQQDGSLYAKKIVSELHVSRSARGLDAPDERACYPRGLALVRGRSFLAMLARGRSVLRPPGQRHAVRSGDGLAPTIYRFGKHERPIIPDPSELEAAVQVDVNSVRHWIATVETGDADSPRFTNQRS
jgi:hypothetical protein